MPPRRSRHSRHGEDGTASVELIGVIPFVLFAVAVAAQAALAGHALWSASVAARAGARAALVGGDPEEVARRALPPSLRGDARVEEGEEVRVRVRVPALIPSLPPIRVQAGSDLDHDDG